MPRLAVMLRLPADAVADLDAARAEALTILGVPALEDAGPPHLTLLYAGEVGAEVHAEVVQAVADTLADRIPIPLHGAGLHAFEPREGEPTPIVVDYGAGGWLASLNADLLRATAQHIAADQFPCFRAHATVGYLPRAVTEDEASRLPGSLAGRAAWQAVEIDVVADDAVLASFTLGVPVEPPVETPERAFSDTPGAGAELIPDELLPVLEVPMSERALDPTVIHRSFMLVQRAEGDAASADAGKRVKWRFTASAAVEDRMGDIVEQDWDLTEFKQNPVLLFSHEGSNFPVGKVEGIDVEDGQLMADTKADDNPVNPRGQLVAHLLREGMLNAVSVGFRSGEMVSRRELPAGDKRRADRGYILRKNKLLELSVVPIPALQVALVQRGLGGLTLRDFDNGEKPPMVAALEGMLSGLAGMPMTGDPDDDYASVVLAMQLSLMAASVAYLSVGKDASMRKFAQSYVKGGGERVASIQAWKDGRVVAAKEEGAKPDDGVGSDDAAAEAAALAAAAAAAAVEEEEPAKELPLDEEEKADEGETGADDAAVNPDEEPPLEEDPAKALASLDINAMVRSGIDAFLEGAEGQALIARAMEAAALAKPAVTVKRKGFLGLPPRG